MTVGDYVRTKREIIKASRIYERADGNMVFDDENGRQWYFTEIKKSSPNIIDLIEENDIVNHSRVVCIGVSTDLSGTHKYLVLENGSNCANGNIKSIVTHEQFSQMEYRIGE